MRSPGLSAYLDHRAQRERRRRTQAQELEATLEHRLQQSEALADITQRVLEGVEVDELVADLCEATAEALDADYCEVFELHTGEDELVLYEGVGWPDDAIGAKTLQAGEGSQPGHTVRTWEPTVVEDLREDERFPTPELLSEEGILSGVTVVVPGPGDPWGLFGVHDRQPRAFDEHDTTFAQSMSHVLSHAVLRERAAREIHRSEERFRSLVEEVDEYAIFMLDRDGRVQSWNSGARRIKGYTESEILGEHFSVFYPPEDREAGVPEANLERAARNGAVQDEGWRVRKDGSRFYANVSITALHDDDGSLYGFAKVTRDMTERRNREKRLQASNERLEQFAYAASHDLQEPLRRVSSYLGLIRRRHGDEIPEDAHELFVEAEDGAQRMSDLIDSLLAYARVRSEGRQPRPVDARAVLDDALSDLSLQIEESGATVTVDELPRVQADPDQLAQVFRNLVSNALKYSGDEPPDVHVTAQRDGDRWQISVLDRGIGIPPDETDHIFDVFGRLGRADDLDGTGIGLAICEQIVDRHGGRLWVDSRPGEGSAFHFTMPRPGSEIQPPPARETETSRPGTRR